MAIFSPLFTEAERREFVLFGICFYLGDFGRGGGRCGGGAAILRHGSRTARRGSTEEGESTSGDSVHLKCARSAIKLPI